MDLPTNQSRRRKQSAILAVILAILMALSGTYAWLSINQQATNALEGTSDPGGRVHDDFDGTNKDVYAENFGDSNIFARIKLSEYMEINGEPFQTGATKTNKAGWAVHIPSDNNPAVCDNAADGKFHQYVSWTMGGDNKIYMPTFNMVTDQSVAQGQWTDTTGIATDDITNTQTGVCRAGDTVADAGVHNYWANGETLTATASYWDGTEVATKSETHTAHKVVNIDSRIPEIVSKNGVITMADWLRLGKPTGNFWVYDSDGWAYWANALEPGTATSLLLNSIKVTEPDGSWYYAINVNGEFCNSLDLNQWTDMTANAALLMDLASGVDYTVEVSSADNASSVDLGGALQFSAGIYRDGKAQSDPAVAWSIVGDKAAGTTISNTGLLTVSDTENVHRLTIRATDPASGKYADMGVVVNLTQFLDSTGVEWRVLTTQGDYKLLITDQVYGLDAAGNGTAATSFYNTTNDYTLYEASNLKTIMAGWYTANTSPALKAMACDYTYQDNAGSPVTKNTTGAGIEFDFTGSNWLNGDPSATYYAYDTGYDRAVTQPGAKGAGTVFPLSITEVNRYFAPPAGYVVNPDRVAYNANNSTQARGWWLRSPGGSATIPVMCVNTTGVVNNNTATNAGYGYRPALWIEP